MKVLEGREMIFIIMVTLLLGHLVEIIVNLALISVKFGRVSGLQV